VEPFVSSGYVPSVAGFAKGGFSQVRASHDIIYMAIPEISIIEKRSARLLLQVILIERERQW
jgi:hypothetical protein